MNKSLKIIASAAVLSLAAIAPAKAAGISVGIFDLDDFNTATASPTFTIQDFEGFAVGDVGIQNQDGDGMPGLMTNVGLFTSLGGTGTGDTCARSRNPVDQSAKCTDLSIFQPGPNGQIGLVPDTTGKSLNANDTLGIGWEVDTGSMFNRIVFAMSDAGDQRASVTISATGLDSVSGNVGGTRDGNTKLVIIDFGTKVSGATIEIRSSKVNDSLAIDGASVGVVPLPAAAWMLLAGIGGLAAMRRRQKA